MTKETEALVDSVKILNGSLKVEAAKKSCSVDRMKRIRALIDQQEEQIGRLEAEIYEGSEASVSWWRRVRLWWERVSLWIETG